MGKAALRCLASPRARPLRLAHIPQVLTRRLGAGPLYYGDLAGLVEEYGRHKETLRKHHHVVRPLIRLRGLKATEICASTELFAPELLAAFL